MTQLSFIPHDGRTRAVHTSEEFDVYAGRARNVDPRDAAPGADGWLGNPHTITAVCPVCRVWHREPSDALTAFEFGYFRPRLATDEAFRRAVLALKGKRLGCPGCETGSPCHARIIAEWVEANTERAP